LSKYNKLKKAIRCGRKNRANEICAFEEKFLQKLRVERGIDCENHDQQQRKNCSKKCKLNADKPVEDIRVHKAISTVDDEDENE
jgi:hypothetical protein